MADRKDLYKKLRTLSHGAARGLSKDRLQAFGVEDAASTNFEMNT
jgi:hypothetical protein